MTDHIDTTRDDEALDALEDPDIAADFDAQVDAWVAGD